MINSCLSISCNPICNFIINTHLVKILSKFCQLLVPNVNMDEGGIRNIQDWDFISIVLNILRHFWLFLLLVLFVHYDDCTCPGGNSYTTLLAPLTQDNVQGDPEGLGLGLVDLIWGVPRAGGPLL